MADNKNFWAQQRPDGKWEAKSEGSGRALKIFDIQAEAWKYAQEKARETKGEAFLKGRDGKIRERNTYGKDPYPPKVYAANTIKSNRDDSNPPDVKFFDAASANVWGSKAAAG